MSDSEILVERHYTPDYIPTPKPKPPCPRFPYMLALFAVMAGLYLLLAGEQIYQYVQWQQTDRSLVDLRIGSAYAIATDLINGRCPPDWLVSDDKTVLMAMGFLTLDREEYSRRLDLACKDHRILQG